MPGFAGLFGGKTKAPVYKLTELGKQKHDQMGAEGPRLDILVYLNDNGDSSIREISERSGMPEQKVKIIISNMEREGLIETRK